MKLLYNEHIWDRFIHVYSTGEDGFKKVADKLGLDRGSAAHRLRRLNLPKKIHVSTRKKLSGIRQINERTRMLNRKWNALLKQARSPLKPSKDQLNARSLAWYYKNRSKAMQSARIRSKIYYQRNKLDPNFLIDRALRLKEYRERNPERFAEYNKRFYKRNTAKARSATKRWAMVNPLKHKLITRAHDKRRRKKPYRVILGRLRTRLKDLIVKGRANRGSIHKLIGCSPAHLVAHIQAQFTTGMGWHNRSHWHIDHIRPCASFNLNDPVQLSQCWHWTNFQPLWAADNLAKGASYVAA